MPTYEVFTTFTPEKINLFYDKPISIAIEVMLRNKITRCYIPSLWFTAIVPETDCFMH
jgi:hypothetical protein